MMSLITQLKRVTFSHFAGSVLNNVEWMKLTEAVHVSLCWSVLCFCIYTDSFTSELCELAVAPKPKYCLSVAGEACHRMSCRDWRLCSFLLHFTVQQKPQTSGGLHLWLIIHIILLYNKCFIVSTYTGMQ